MPFTDRPRPERPALRPAYQGSNPISDIWSLQALRMVAQFLVRAVDDPSDDEARANMLLAASYAGVGFGNAGVHLPHGMSYPVSGNVKSYSRPGLRHRSPAGAARHVGHPQRAGGVPIHGARQSRPAICRRPRRWARTCRGRDAEDAGKILADRITWFMQRLKMPNGLRAIGYSSSDIPALVEGTLPQHRVTKLSPRPAGPDELARAVRRRDGRVVTALRGLRARRVRAGSEDPALHHQPV